HRDLLEPRGRNAANFRDHLFDRKASRPSACDWDNAIRTLLAASGLHAQRKRGSTADTGFEYGATTAVTISETICCCQLRLEPDYSAVRDEVGEDERNRPGLVVIGNDAQHVRQASNLVRPARRITSGDDDVCSGIHPANPPDCLSRRLVGTGGYRTGVHHHDISLGSVGCNRASGSKAFFD